MDELLTRSGDKLDRLLFESLLRRRFFWTEAFEIYRTSGTLNADNRGLYDYGPPGCALQANVVDAWRKHFVLEEDMLELDCTMLTPEAVFKTSGHIERFADWMCKDAKKGEFLRADHLIQNVLEGRLKGNKIARGLHIDEDETPSNAKRKKGKVENVKAARLDDKVVAEYEEILAKV
jgi:glycyl-tRNA synthetase